jgi:hypothetical protein
MGVEESALIIASKGFYALRGFFIKYWWPTSETDPTVRIVGEWG